MERSVQIRKVATETFNLEAENIINLSAHLDVDFIAVVEQIYESKGKLVITGIGKSAIIGMKIVATLNSTGTSAAFLHAAEAIHGDLGIIAENDIVLCISKSGHSPEIKMLAPIILERGNTLVAMTAEKESFLAKSAHHVLHTPVSKEACPNNLAPTTSTVVQLAMGDALATCLMTLKGFDTDDFAKVHPGGQLGKTLRLTVGEMILHHGKPEVNPNTPMKEVIHEITNKRLGATAVIDKNNIVGIITDGDLRRMLEKHDTINALCAADIMIPNPIKVKNNTLAKEALGILKLNKINHLVIHTPNGNYLGIVNLLDFIKEGLSNE